MTFLALTLWFFSTTPLWLSQALFSSLWLVTGLYLLLFPIHENNPIVTVGDTGNAATNGSNLDTALSAATAGTVIELMPGATYRYSLGGRLVSAASLALPVQLRTKGYGKFGWPAPTYRITPSYTSLMAIIEPDPAALTTPALNFAEGSHNYLVKGIRFYAPSTSYATPFQVLVQVNPDPGATNLAPTTGQNTVFSTDIGFYHCLFQGHTTYGAYSGLIINGCDDLVVKDCYFDQFFTVEERPVFSFSAGHRPRMTNTYFSDGSETVFVGGGGRYPNGPTSDAIAAAKWLPEDVQFRYCEFTRNRAHYLRSPVGKTIIADLKVSATVNTRVASASNYVFSALDEGKTVWLPALEGFETAYRTLGTFHAGSGEIAVSAITTVALGGSLSTGSYNAHMMVKYGNIKNLFETKGCNSISFYGCKFGPWYNEQQSQPLNFTSIDQSYQQPPASNTWIYTRDIRMDYCLLYETNGFFFAQGWYVAAQYQGAKGSGLYISNMLVRDISIEYHGGIIAQEAMQITAWDNVKIDNLTMWRKSGATYAYRNAMSAAYRNDIVTGLKGHCPGFRLKNSIIIRGYGDMYNSDKKTSASAVSLWNGLFADLDWYGDNGAVRDFDVTYNIYPGANEPTTLGAAEMPGPVGTYNNMGDNSSTAYTQANMESTHFEDVSASNLQLKVTSNLNTNGSNGSRRGCDVATLNTILANIR